LLLPCHAVNGNSTRSPSQDESQGIDVDGDGDGTEPTTSTASSPPSSSSSDPASSSAAAADEVEAQESLGRALSELRRANAAKESPGRTEEFWRGVAEETRLIEWPSLQRVLSTTGVVVSIIFGSSLVLLTVNALLAELSDVVFKNTSVPPPV
jgi:preprotein translocase SecE subunit